MLNEKTKQLLTQVGEWEGTRLAEIGGTEGVIAAAVASSLVKGLMPFVQARTLTVEGLEYLNTVLVKSAGMVEVEKRAGGTVLERVDANLHN